MKSPLLLLPLLFLLFVCAAASDQCYRGIRADSDGVMKTTVEDCTKTRSPTDFCFKCRFQRDPFGNVSGPYDAYACASQTSLAYAKLFGGVCLTCDTDLCNHADRILSPGPLILLVSLGLLMSY